MKKQQGSALIIVLVILVLVTLIGTLAIRSGILGLKGIKKQMIANLQSSVNFSIKLEY